MPVDEAGSRYVVLTAFGRQVEDVLFGANGVVAPNKPGTIIAVAAAISPTGMRNFARRLQQAGMIPLDIPLCRGSRRPKPASC